MTEILSLLFPLCVHIENVTRVDIGLFPLNGTFMLRPGIYDLREKSHLNEGYYFCRIGL